MTVPLGMVPARLTAVRGFLDEDGHLAVDSTPARDALNLLRAPQAHAATSAIAFSGDLEAGSPPENASENRARAFPRSIWIGEGFCPVAAGRGLSITAGGRTRQ